MMHPNDYTSLLAKAIEEIVRQLTESLTVFGEEITEELRRSLEQQGIDLDPSSGIKPTAANLKRLAVAIETAFGKPILAYDQFVTDGLLKLEAINRQYINFITGGHTNTAAFQAIRTSAINTVALTSGQDIAKEGLKDAVKTTAQQFATSGANFFDMVDYMRDAISGKYPNQKGDKVDYAALQDHYRHFHQIKRVVRDAAFSYNREYIRIATDKYGFDLFYYSGGLVEDSRRFCMDRADKVWHIKEVQEWANTSWPEKKPRTNRVSIFTLLGGWNCRHTLVPCTIVLATPADVTRMQSKSLI